MRRAVFVAAGAIAVAIAAAWLLLDERGTDNRSRRQVSAEALGPSSPADPLPPPGSGAPAVPIATSPFDPRLDEDAASGRVVDLAGRPLAFLTLKAIPSGPSPAAWMDAIMTADVLTFVTATRNDGIFRIRSPARRGKPFHLAIRRQDDRWFVAEGVTTGLRDLVVTLPDQPPPPRKENLASLPWKSELKGSGPGGGAGTPAKPPTPQELKKLFDESRARVLEKHRDANLRSEPLVPPEPAPVTKQQDPKPDPASPTPLVARDSAAGEGFPLWELAPGGPRKEGTGRPLVYSQAASPIPGGVLGIK